VALIRTITRLFDHRSTRRVAGVALTMGPALLIVLALIGLILLSLNKDPGSAVSDLAEAILYDETGRANVLMKALPMLLCTSGLLLTFTAGLWNIGVEGQIMMGAVFATILARNVADDASWLAAVPVELALAMIGGALWGALAALLKTRGNVNEIFGGVALNFIARNILLYLLNGPWKSGSYQSTKVFADPARFPPVEAGSYLSLPAIVLAVIGFLVIFFVLRGTRWGLQLKAMGRSERSAFLLGVRTSRNVLLSMMACGALAGLAGAFLILAPNTSGRLSTEVSGGIGFLGLLIAMLINYRAAWILPVVLFFAMVPVGSIKLQTSLSLDPSLGKVFQSALVLAVLLANGVRARLQRASGE
jgi:simple sugar transport system permease protein